jgi:hypothetical protein
VIGVYSEAGNVWDIVVMLIFAVLGYLMKKLGYEAAPLVLAFVLGRMAEESIRQCLLMSRGSFDILLDAATRHHLHRRGAGGHGAPRGAPERPGRRPDAGDARRRSRCRRSSAGPSCRCPTDRAMRHQRPP